MRRTLVTYFVAFAGFAGWASAAGAAQFSATGSVPTTFPVTGSIVPALEVAPDELLSAATLMVTANLQQDKNLPTSDPERFAKLVESTILPLFDFNHMTQLAMARNWRLASPQQQNLLIAEFRMLLVRTYSMALINCRDRTLVYKPLRMAPGETEVTVRSTVRQSGAERMTVDYDMEKTTAGWMVYDIKIAGISLIKTYRSSFAQTIREGGVDELIKSLTAQNRLADFAFTSGESDSRPLLFMYAVIPSLLRGGQ